MFKRSSILFAGLSLLFCTFFTLQASAAADKTDKSVTSLTIGDKIIAAGLKYLGTPYVYGSDPSQTKTFDCSSFTFRAFTENGINLPRTANAQYNLGTSVTLDEAKPGDLMFFRDSVYLGQAGHVSIYMGNDTMLHAASSGKGVRTGSVSHPYWKQKLIGIKRVIPTVYTVKPGDNLWSISLANQMTLQELRSWNKLKTDELQAGQLLMIENPDLLMTKVFAKGKSYVVQPRDTLWTISGKNQVSIEQLRSWNELKKDEIYIGQRLKLEAPFKTYTVVPGDSLWSVSQKTKTPESFIKKANKLTSDTLFVDQVLQIPVLF